MEPDLKQIFGSYTAWKADDATWFINFMNGSENMYLLEGDEKALLIDTGYGAGNLRAFVETLTDKPVLVVTGEQALLLCLPALFGILMGSLQMA